LEARDFISKLIVKDVESRMTTKEALRHPWLSGQAMTPTFDTRLTDSDSALLQRLKEFKRPRLLKKEAVKLLLRILEEKHTEPLKQGFNHLDKNK
jgi:serine/threonine protein kinase